MTRIIKEINKKGIPFNFGEQSLDEVLNEFELKGYIIRINRDKFEIPDNIRGYIEDGDVKEEIELWLKDYFTEVFFTDLYSEFLQVKIN